MDKLEIQFCYKQSQAARLKLDRISAENKAKELAYCKDAKIAELNKTTTWWIIENFAKLSQEEISMLVKILKEKHIISESDYCVRIHEVFNKMWKYASKQDDNSFVLENEDIEKISIQITKMRKHPDDYAECVSKYTLPDKRPLHLTDVERDAIPFTIMAKYTRIFCRDSLVGYNPLIISDYYHNEISIMAKSSNIVTEEYPDHMIVSPKTFIVLINPYKLNHDNDNPTTKSELESLINVMNFREYVEHRRTDYSYYQEYVNPEDEINVRMNKYAKYMHIFPDFFNPLIGRTDEWIDNTQLAVDFKKPVDFRDYMGGEPYDDNPDKGYVEGSRNPSKFYKKHIGAGITRAQFREQFKLFDEFFKWLTTRDDGAPRTNKEINKRIKAMLGQYVWACKKCGVYFYHDPHSISPCVCPDCGAKYKECLTTYVNKTGRYCRREYLKFVEYVDDSYDPNTYKDHDTNINYISVGIDGCCDNHDHHMFDNPHNSDY